MTAVVTYRHAYVTGQSDLCVICERDAAVLEELPALEPVDHGEHDGECDGEPPSDAEFVAAIRACDPLAGGERLAANCIADLPAAVL